MRLKVTAHRDEDLKPTRVEIKRGYRKLFVDYIYSPAGDWYSLEFKGRKEDLPSLPEIMALVDSKRIDRIGTIELINLITKIIEIVTVSNITSIDLVDIVNKISEITTIKKIESVESGISFDSYSLTSKTKVLDKLAFAYDGSGNIETIKGYEGAVQKYTLTFTWTEGALTQIVRT